MEKFHVGHLPHRPAHGARAEVPGIAYHDWTQSWRKTSPIFSVDSASVWRLPVYCSTAAPSISSMRPEKKKKNATMGQVKGLARNKTVFLISPGWPMWLTPIRFVCLWQGVISEQGTHEELLSRRGEYAHLWNAQQQLEACRERDK